MLISPALGGVVLRLRPGREARSLDHDHGAAGADGLVDRRDRGRESFAVGVGERHVHGAGLHERLGAAQGAVDELVGYDDRSWSDLRPEAADGAGRKHLAHAERPQGPGVGPVVDEVGRVLVVPSVPGQERHAAASDGADRNRCRRGAVRRLDRVLLGIVEEGVEAGAADDRDVGDGRAHRGTPSGRAECRPA
jgi:hypothetical protein